MQPALRNALALSVALLSTLPTASRAEGRDSLQALNLGQGLVVFLGSRSAEPEVPELRLAGSGSETPRLRLRWTRSAAGRWSAANQLPEAAQGSVFEHRRQTWSLGLNEAGEPGPPVIWFAPLGPDFSRAYHEAPRAPSAQAVAAAGLDPWSFGIVQQLPRGRLIVEELTSHGPDALIERAGQLALTTAWPSGARLLGLAGEAGQLAVFARGLDGDLLGLLAQGESWEDFASLDLPASAQATGLWLDGRPAAFVAANREIAIWSLEAEGWRQRGSIAVPARPLWTASVFGPGLTQVAALAVSGDTLEAWTWRSGSWSAESVPAGRTSAVLKPPPPEPAPRDTRQPLRPPAWVLGLALLATLLGGLLGARLLRR